MSAQDSPTVGAGTKGFGALLRRYRAAAGLTQQEVADRTGLSVDAVSLLERGGRRHPHRYTVEKLADALGLVAEERALLEQAGRSPRPGPGLSSAPVALGRSALPIPPTPLIGRADIVASVAHLLRRADVRLLTLTGAGGAGKTRVALAVAAEIRATSADGIVFVPLAEVRDPALLVSTVAQALGVEETSGQPLLESLRAALSEREIVVILDNFEHLLGAAPLVADLVAQCRRIKVLVTSRAPLTVRGEHQIPVPPLPLPDPAPSLPVEALIQNPAVDLFVQRAQAVAPGFSLTRANGEAVTAICRALDGLPLALELAAVWVKVLPPRELLQRLGGPPGPNSLLQVLVGGPRDLPERQQTLRHTLDWSYEFLDEGERTLFRRLAVFAGSVACETIDAVLGAGSLRGEEESATASSLPGLMVLVDKSLVRSDVGGEQARFSMLETVRTYAQEHLAAREERTMLHRRHAAYYADLAERARPELSGPDQAAWLARLEEELPNLRAALQWASHNGALEAGLRLSGALWPFWNRRGYLSEGRTWLDGFLAQVSAHTETVPAQIYARALNGAGVLASRLGDGVAAEVLFEQSVPLFRASGDGQALAVVLNNLGWAAFRRGDYARTVTLCEESAALARGLGEMWNLAAALNSLGGVAYMQGDYARAATLYEEGVAIYRAGGDDWARAQCLANLAQAALGQGDAARAMTLAQEGLVLQRRLGDTMGAALTLTNLSTMALEQGQVDHARVLAQEGLGLRRELNDAWGIGESLKTLADIAVAEGDSAQARTLYAESLARYGATGDRDGSAACLEALAVLAASQGQPRWATRLMGAATSLRQATGTARMATDQAVVDRVVLAAQTALGADTFAALWAEGQSLSPAEVATEAPDDWTPRPVPAY